MNDRPAVCYETGLDESFLVGTPAEIRALGQTLLDAATSEGDSTDYLGVPTRSVPAALSEPMAEVVLDGVLLVKTKQDRQELMNRIRLNNGEPPIDWETREKHQQPDRDATQ